MSILTGFGIPDTQDFAFFNVLRTSTGEYPDWSPDLRYVEDAIVGSSNFEVQLLGFGSARLTLRIELDSREAFRAFQSHWGKRETLRLLAEFTRHEGVVKHLHGRDYELFADTILLDISNVAHQVGGAVECDATFIRSTSNMGVSLP